MLAITLRVWGLCIAKSAPREKRGGLTCFKWASLFFPNELKDKRAARGDAFRNKRPIRLGLVTLT